MKNSFNPEKYQEKKHGLYNQKLIIQDLTPIRVKIFTLQRHRFVIKGANASSSPIRCPWDSSACDDSGVEANLVLNPGENEQPRKVAKGVVLMGVDSSGC